MARNDSRNDRLSAARPAPVSCALSTAAVAVTLVAALAVGLLSLLDAAFPAPPSPAAHNAALRSQPLQARRLPASTVQAVSYAQPQARAEPTSLFAD